MKNKFKILRNVVCFAILIISGSGVFASSTANLLVNATIVPTCTVLAATLAFGNYNPTSSSNLDATTNINVTCTTGTGYHVKLDKGSNGASTTARQMKGITNTTSLLNYAIYYDSGRTSNWGNNANNSDSPSGVGTGLVQAVPVYGRILSGQTSLPADTYTDIVQISITVP